MNCLRLLRTAGKHGLCGGRRHGDGKAADETTVLEWRAGPAITLRSVVVGSDRLEKCRLRLDRAQRSNETRRRKEDGDVGAGASVVTLEFMML
jgi:hypothetical protein